MKKILVLLVFIVFFSGCSTNKFLSPPTLDLNFKGNVSITYKEYNLKCSIKNSLSTGCEIVICEPAILKGFSFVINEGVCTFKFDNISFGIDSNKGKIELADSIYESLINVLSTTKYEKTSDNNWKYMGNTSFGKFILVQDAVTGYPILLEIPEINVEVVFNDLKSIDS